MCLSRWAAMTDYHRLGGLNNKKFFSDSSRVWKFKVKVPVGSVSGDFGWSGPQTATFSLPSRVLSSVCSLRSTPGCLLEAHQSYWIGTPPSWLINLNYLQIQSQWRVGPHRVDLGEATVQSVADMSKGPHCRVVGPRLSEPKRFLCPKCAASPMPRHPR